jgi:hypothetical protein
MSKEKSGNSTFEKSFNEWASGRFEDVALWTKEELDDFIENYDCQVAQFPWKWELKLSLADAKLLRSALDVPSIETSISKIKPRPFEEPNVPNYSFFYEYLWAKFWYDLIFGEKKI